MDNIQIGATLIGFAGLLLTALTYLLHSYIWQLHERVQKIEEMVLELIEDIRSHKESISMIDLFEFNKRIKKIEGFLENNLDEVRRNTAIIKLHEKVKKIGDDRNEL